ncbi:hypothetical protein As57867_016763, partial [Aphanomyces stellatus]
MKYPTLESMARMTKCAPIVHSNASNDSVSGAIPLTPIQHLNFKHPWENVNYWNLSMTLLCRQNIGLDALKAAVSRLENHHDMLRTRFQNDADSGWTQHVLEASLDVPPNVELICIASFDDLEEAVLQKERSLNLVSGPVYAVTVFETTDNIQYLQFTLHHTIADLVSWRILLDDLQRVLQNGMLSSKTTSFKEWSKKLSKKALEWDPSPWLDYMGNDITPPFDRCRGQTHKYQVRLDANITMTLDSANTAYGTNIQELALAALAESFAHVRESSGFDDRHLYLMMEGHGRESWDTSLDVSSTVGWFTCEYPLVLAGMNNISTLVRQVKQKLRGVPEKGLSYGAIKYLLPKSKDTEQIHLHKRHNISFNYAGRFQELNKDDNLFGEVDGLYVPQHEEGEAEFCPGSIGLSHLDDTLVLDISVPDWILTRDEVDAWGDLWCEWMTRIRDHCLDTETIGGRTLSDVPLLGSTLVVHSVEAELMSTLHLRPLDVEDIYPITPLQSGILSAMIRDPAEYVIQLVFDICGNFSFSQLKTCWQQMANETPLLRTVFASTLHGIYQAVTKYDLSEWFTSDGIWSPGDLDGMTKSFLNRDRERGFTLAAKSFHRFFGVRVLDGRTRVIWTHHHSLMDGWSLPMLMDKLLAKCYGEQHKIAFVPFKDQVEWLSRQPFEPSRLFWARALENANQRVSLALPTPLTQENRTDLAKHKTILHSLHLPELGTVCKKLEVTESSVFRTAWAILLQQYTRSDYVVFGSVVSGRDTDLDGVERIVGILINTVPIQAHVTRSSLVVDLIGAVHNFSMDLAQHSHCHLVDVKRWANIAAEVDLFDSILVYENYPVSDIDRSINRSFTIDIQGAEEYVDSSIGVIVSPTTNGFQISISYRACEIDGTVMEYLMDRFIYILISLSTASVYVKTIADLDSPTMKEKSLVRLSCFGPIVPLPYELLHQAFEERSKKHPDARAIEFEGEWLSYAELNTQASILACELATMGICVGSRVAVMMERCLEFPIGLLAVLKVGASMMPLDVTFPQDRLAFMLLDADVAAIITTTLNVGRVVNNLMLKIPCVCVNAKVVSSTSHMFEPSNQQFATRENEAYIVYTSGSTGKPKGVPVLHKGAVNVISYHHEGLQLGEGIRMLQFKAIGFDGCQWDMWKALSTGATLVLRGNNVLEVMSTVDVVSITTTGLSHLGDPKNYPRLKVVAQGGESMPSSLKNLWSPHVCLLNCYGPSECAIETHVTKLQIQSAISVGRVIPNVNCYVLDNFQHTVPLGVIGEIYLGGICVSPGYINLPDQTSQRFLNDPFVGSGRMYRTGDLGRLLPNGDFEILGRQDSQVKLKGYRIELEEVAEAMMQHPLVISAAAIVKDNSHLVGYFSPATVSADELQEIVAGLLPVYMVPAVWVGLDTMPQNSNGKIDKNALEKLDIVADSEELQTDVEARMAAVWAQVLEIDVRSIGRQSSFFALGGDSISVIKVVAACKDAGLAISASQLLKGMVLWRAASFVEEEAEYTWPYASVSDQVIESISKEWLEPKNWGDCDIYPVTPLQAGMIFETTKNPSAYILQSTMALETHDAKKVKIAFKTLVAMREILRTTFATSPSGIYQIIHCDSVEFEVAEVFSPVIEEFLSVDSTRGFEIGAKFFVRMTIVTTETATYAVLSIHHALYDGWSISMLTKDLMDVLNNEKAINRPSFRTVVDYIEAQNKHDTKEYWVSYLSGISVTPIGQSNLNCSAHENVGALRMEFKTPLSNIAKRVQRVGVTVAEFAKLAWAITLRKYTRQDDVIFGQVLSNRDIHVKDVDKILGPLISTVPWRVHFNDSLSLISLFEAAHSDRGSMPTYSHASITDFKRWGGIEGDLFDTIFVYQNLPHEAIDRTSPSFSFVQSQNSIHSNEFTYELIVEPNDTQITARALYKPSMLSWTQARYILDEFENTLDQLYTLVELNDIPVSTLWKLSPTQTQLIEAASIGPVVPLPYELLHHAFEEWAQNCPDVTAVEFVDKSLSYGELNAQANALASLLADKCRSIGSRVAVIMDRCLEFPIGLLATLKIGASMMPLDASFPQNRVKYFVLDGQADVVVTTEKYRNLIGDMKIDIPVVYIDCQIIPQLHFNTSGRHMATREDEAFVVYTSGSTGKPKGVPVLHKGAVNVVANSAAKANIKQGTRVMQFMAIGFDACQWETWKTISNGATLVLRHEVVDDSLSTIDVLMCTPTALSLMGHPSAYPNLKSVCVAGEAISSQLKDLWCPSVCFMNVYGPTECSIATHFVELTAKSLVTVGPALPNVSCYILDNRQRSVPVGCVGEICLGGICVAPGYINMPEETNLRFVDDQFIPGGKMFRTGDLGRLLPNGHFEVLGRQDSQVKLKGYRIELDEVAETITSHPGVVTAAVIVKDNTHLVGYFTPANVDVASLRMFVASQLPIYMQPAVWVGLEVMPQNSNGKIDKKALNEYTIDTQVDVLETNTEIQLANIWAQVLGSNVSEIGRHTSFFSLGGDSITAIRMVAKAKQVGLILTGAIAMKYPTLESMARMTKCAPIVHSNASNDSVSGAIPLTPIQHLNFKHPWENVNYWNLSMTLLCRQNIGLDALKAAVSRLENHHDMLRTRFQNDADSGWTQHVLEASLDVPPNVELICIASFDDLEEAVLQKERSLNLVSGPVYAVTVFETTDNIQYLQFTLHHTIADLVSWRILLDDLQRVLQNGMLSSKTTSFKEWSKKLSKKALEWDPSPWLDYMGNDITPPFDRCRGQTHKYQVRLDANITMTLDSANTAYGTNIQELALAALAESFAHVRESSGFDDRHLYLMMEGHGRESWDTSLDVSSTVGWFTCEYPLVLAGMNNISTLVRQVKQKLRGVPEKGLSYGAIKYLLPKSKDTEQIHLHKRHNISFNYAGRFQELNKDDNLFGEVDGLYVPQHEEGEAEFCPGSIGLSHLDDTLVLDISVPDWILTRDEVDAWGDLWCEWMTRIRDHCLDTETIGGRTLSDVPLLGSTLVVHSVEAELMSTLHLRPLDVEDIYPITPLQSGILSAMIRDPAEYVIQLVFDIC